MSDISIYNLLALQYIDKTIDKPESPEELYKSYRKALEQITQCAKDAKKDNWAY